MGRRYEEVSEEMKMVPYEVVKSASGAPEIKASGKDSLSAADLPR